MDLPTIVTILLAETTQIFRFEFLDCRRSNLFFEGKELEKIFRKAEIFHNLLCQRRNFRFISRQRLKINGKGFARNQLVQFFDKAVETTFQPA